MMKEREKLKIKHANLGSWDNGDIMHRVVGVRTVPINMMVLCKCEWMKRANGYYPINSWVPMESIKEREPYILLSYFEFVQRMFGSKDKHIHYKLYFTKEDEEMGIDKLKPNLNNPEQQLMTAAEEKYLTYDFANEDD